MARIHEMLNTQKLREEQDRKDKSTVGTDSAAKKIARAFFEFSKAIERVVAEHPDQRLTIEELLTGGVEMANRSISGNWQEIGNSLRKIRREKGLNFVDIADRIGCSVSEVSKMERGEASPVRYLALDGFSLIEGCKP